MAIRMKVAAAMLAKRFVNQVLPPTASLSISSPSLTLRRALHESVYDKNIEEEITSKTEILNETNSPQPEEYWAPDPETGIFAPASEQNQVESDNVNHGGGLSGSIAEGSVLEETAFFRPSEDLEPPPPHPFTGEAPPHPFTEDLPTFTSSESKSEEGVHH